MTIADAAWWLDDVSLNTRAYYVREVDESTPTRRGENQPTPGVSGRRYVPGKPFDERTLSLMMVIDAVNPIIATTRSGAQLQANLDAVKLLFSKDGTHVLKRTHGSATRQMTVEVRDLRIARGGPYHYNVAAELAAPDPYWYPLTQATFSKTLNTLPLLPANLALTNNGTYKAEKAVITIDGPITNPKVAIGSSWVQWTGTLAVSDKLIIDCGTFDALVDLVSVDPYSDVRNVTWATATTRWLEIPTGAATATLSGSGATSGSTKLKIDFYEAYL